MYVPSYVGGVGLNTAATPTQGSASLCLPQYVAFNPLQHQYR